MLKNNLSSQTWIVMPGFNEAKYLNQALKKTLKFTKNIIYVDDGSRDSSVKIAQKNLKHVLVHEVNLGKGAALKTGCDYAFSQLKAKVVILMDADDQHDPAELPLFQERLTQGAPVVLGARSLFSTMPLMRKLGNAFVSGVVLVLFWRYIPDILSGYKAFTKKAYQQIRWNAADYSVELEIASKIAKHKLDFALVSIKTIYHDQDKGMSVIDA
ncbi:MAG: glycosyltransferase family 2 protein, partial [Candidatus Paceibacterota bacterium]